MVTSVSRPPAKRREYFFTKEKKTMDDETRSIPHRLVVQHRLYSNDYCRIVLTSEYLFLKTIHVGIGVETLRFWQQPQQWNCEGKQKEHKEKMIKGLRNFLFKK